MCIYMTYLFCKKKIQKLTNITALQRAQVQATLGIRLIIFEKMSFKKGYSLKYKYET